MRKNAKYLKGRILYLRARFRMIAQSDIIRFRIQIEWSKLVYHTSHFRYPIVRSPGLRAKNNGDPGLIVDLAVLINMAGR